MTVPIQAKVPAATPLMTSAPAAAASLPLNHRERLTAPASRWSRRPSASSARAAFTRAAVSNAITIAMIMKAMPRNVPVPLPGAPSREKTCCTDDPTMVAPAALATMPISSPAMATAAVHQMTDGRIRRRVSPIGPESSRRRAALVVRSGQVLAPTSRCPAR